MRILQILILSPAQIANEDVLKRALRVLGHAISSDLLRTEIMWCEEQGLLEIWNENGLYVMQLTQRGDDVGHGLACVSGVDRGSCET